MVERFDLNEGGFLGERGHMEPSADGDYVHVADYADLERQIAELRAEWDEAIEWRDKYQGDCAVLSKWHSEEEERAKTAEADKARLSEALAEILSLEAKGASAHGKWGDAYRIADAALSGSGAGGWRTMESAPKDRRLWLAWNPEDWTYGEGRMVDGGWIACGTFYDAKREPPYRYGEAKVEPVFWMPLLDHLILLAKNVESRR